MNKCHIGNDLSIPPIWVALTSTLAVPVVTGGVPPSLFVVPDPELPELPEILASSVGAAGCSVGAAGCSVGAAGCSVGAAGCSVGAAGCSVGACVLPPAAEHSALHVPVPTIPSAV